MSFVTRRKVRFAHVDAAGIVFYPRYFEMLNSAVEDWFDQALGVDFATLHLERGLGVPTVRLDSEFMAPSRLGDDLDISITVREVGRASCTVDYEITGAGVTRMRASGVLVCMALAQGRAVSWPDDIRAALTGG